MPSNAVPRRCARFMPESPTETDRQTAARPAPPEVDRVAASQAAVAARRARAAVKASIAAREVSPLTVLDRATAEPDGVEGRLRVTEFLLSVPAIGATKM